MRVIVPPREEYVAPPSIHDVWQKVQAATWYGLYWALGVTVVLWAIFTLGLVVGFPGAGGWKHWAAAPLLALIVGLVQMCRFGSRWVVLAASRPWEVDDKIRQRAWELEDEARQAEKEAAEAARKKINEEGGSDGNPSTLDQAQLLHLVAVEMLRRHYVLGQSVTRDAMTAEGLCTQPQWNTVNQAMLAVGLKARKTMRPDLRFQEAWEIWRTGIEIREDGYLWTVNSRGNWKALLKVT